MRDGLVYKTDWYEIWTGIKVGLKIRTGMRLGLVRNSVSVSPRSLSFLGY
jgi:hypothetical protein